MRKLSCFAIYLACSISIFVKILSFGSPVRFTASSNQLSVISACPAIINALCSLNSSPSSIASFFNLRIISSWPTPLSTIILTKSLNSSFVGFSPNISKNSLCIKIFAAFCQRLIISPSISGDKSSISFSAK